MIEWLKRNHKWFYPIVAIVIAFMSLREEVKVLRQAYIGSVEVMTLWAERVRNLEKKHDKEGT